MKKGIAIACCILTLAGCGSATTAPPAAIGTEESEQVHEQDTIIDNGNQSVTIGGFDTQIPSDWIINGDYFYVISDGEYPFVYSYIFDNCDTLDDLFPSAESMTNFIDDFCSSFDNVSYTEPMRRQTYGNNTGLQFVIGQKEDDAATISFVTLFSNPGGGVISFSLSVHGEEIEDSIIGYTNMLHCLTPSAGLETPSDSFQVSTGDLNALSQARKYLSSMHFSYEGLKDQLQFEGYTDRECAYAVDNCGANWKEQAAGKAQDYLDSSAFSRAELIEQLEFEGFTHDQAEYGVSQVYK